MNAGGEVLRVALEAKSTLDIVSPFVKVGALTRILDEVGFDVEIRVVTRWHLTEIVAGVSDLDVWPLLRDRGGQLRLRRRLHAKMFVSDTEVLAGSANVTGAALGWSRDPNDEVILRANGAQAHQVRTYAQRLWNNSVAVNDALHGLFTEQIMDLQDLPDMPDLAEPEQRYWVPLSRDPEDVVAYYRKDLQRLTPGAIEAARSDLGALETPQGLSPEALHTHISLQLLHHPLVRQFEEDLRTKQRFGVALHLVRKWGDYEREEAAANLQTMMRWLLWFQPKRWAYTKAKYSEIFRFVG